MNDEQFNDACCALYESGKVPWPKFKILLSKDSDNPYEHHISACINEHSLREWLWERQASVSSGWLGDCGELQHTWWLRNGPSGEQTEDYRAALLAAVEAVLKETK